MHLGARKIVLWHILCLPQAMNIFLLNSEEYQLTAHEYQTVAAKVTPDARDKPRLDYVSVKTIKDKHCHTVCSYIDKYYDKFFSILSRR